MISRRFAGLCLIVCGCTAIAACRATSVARDPSLLPVTPLFGPVVSRETIRGREEDDGAVMLLVGGATIVRIDLAEQRSARVAIGLAAGEMCWGLARLQDGTLWTLKGRNAVIQIEPDGRVSRAVPLAEPHVGLFAVADRLIYQKATFSVPGPALLTGAPGAAATAPWSAITTRAFPGIARAQVTALNMVACGSTMTAERPCWFPDEAAVSLVGPRGDTRRIVLPGLTVVSPEVLLTSENPPRPIRDAFVDRQGRIWVLSSGAPDEGAGELPGGWILARYTADGSADGKARLREPARLILRADGRRAIVLSGSGHVSEVRAW